MQALQCGAAGFEMGKAAHLRPQPRIAEGLLLSRRFERYALMDSSDGLADALVKIARASGVRLVAEAGRIPLHPEVLDYCGQRQCDPWHAVLYGGEDFQLVATVPRLDEDLLGVLTVIGRVEAADGEPGAWIDPGGGRPLQPLSLSETYRHFGGWHG
jgi:thiamine-monophosphate kinase